ncbi:unnamed protein product [Cuscuta campestris]|uniref:Pentacotripeptide-repeat region of PRORP domain-containing protein n=1 Tax=Cuscuta campestris TaxID=132261 RepID=A0A484KCN8_9ASTE|nr:unnamed protein product [Cuscuta campestris]
MAIPARTAPAETGTYSPRRRFHSHPEIIPSANRNRVHSGHDFNSVRDFDHARELFDQMLRAQPLPSILQFTKLLSKIVKMKHYGAAVCLFKEMRNRGISVDSYALTILTDALCLTNQADCGFSVLGLFFKCGIEVSVVTFNTLIKGLCLNDRIVEAIELFKKLVREEVCQVDNFTYAILMNGLCKMIERGVSPGISIYNSLIQGLCNFCRWKEATKLINEMVGHNVYPDVLTFTILVDAFCKEGRLKDAEAIIQIMIQRNTYPDVITYNTLIEGYCLLGQMDDAQRTLGQMVENGVRPNVMNYNTLINGYCKRKVMDKAMHLFNEMPQKGLYPNTVTYTTVLQGLFLVGRCDAALNLFQDMQLSGHAPKFHTYCVLLTGLCDNGHIEEAMSVYSMLRSNGNGSHVFGSIMIDGLCKMGLLSIARGVLSNLIFKDQYLNVRAYTAMINGLCREGLVHEALDLLRRMGETDCLPDSFTYNVILKEFVRMRKIHEANMLLDEMSSKCISPDNHTLTLMNELLAFGTGNEPVPKVIRKFAANVLI